MSDEEVHRQTLARIRRRALFVLGLFVFVVALKIVAVQWIVLGSVGPVGLALDVLFVFAVFAAVDLFFADMRYRALLITDAVHSLLLTGIAIYHSYYGLLPGRDSIALLGQATTVGTSIATLLDYRLLLLFADIPVLVWWVVRSRRRGVDPVTGRRPGVLIVPGLRTPYVYQRRLVYSAAVVAALAFAWSAQNLRAGPTVGDDRVVAASRGMMTYVTAALMGEQQTASSASMLPVPELQTRIDELCSRDELTPRAGFVPGSAAGANVIIVQVEALQTAAVGARVGGQPVTPNLEKLIAESWYFPNHFSAAGLGTTSDAEFTANTSLYPPQKLAASIAYVDRELSSLPRTLGVAGYETFTLHTNDVHYWNRGQLYPALGFGTYFDKAHFGTADTIAFGASDRVLYDKTFTKLDQTQRAGRPFYAHIITMSSHFPFTGVPADRRTLPLVEPYIGTIEGDYLVEMHYMDLELGKFIEQLRSSGILDRSVLVVYGDHFGLPEPRNEAESAAVRSLLGREYTPVDKLATPLLVRIPGQVGSQVVTETVGTIDIAPSIAEALGVPTDDMAVFGRSVFWGGETLFSAGGLLPAGAYADAKTLYIPGASFADGEAWDVATRSPVDISAASEEKFEATKELLELSRGYVSGLPARSDYDAKAKRVLPIDAR